MRKRKDFKRIEGVKSSRLIVIAAEGRATENIYFEAMRQELCASNVQLVVLNRADYNPYQLLPHISIAIERAELLDTNPKDRWPQGIGTRVYLLAKSIMNKE